MKIVAALLAAGASRRLGQPKQLVEIDGVPAVRRQAMCIMEAGVDELLVITGCRHAEVEGVLQGLALRTVHNPDWASGMASSLVAGVHAAGPDSAVVIATCDQINLEPADFRRLVEAFRRTPSAVIAAGYNGVRGVPAVFPPTWQRRLLGLRGDQGARRLIDGDDTLTVSMENAAFDLDTPEQLKGFFLG